MKTKKYVAFIIMEAEKRVSEQEIKDLLPPDDLAGKGLELIKITVLES